jgi:hypothetical protein
LGMIGGALPPRRLLATRYLVPVRPPAGSHQDDENVLTAAALLEERNRK